MRELYVGESSYKLISISNGKFHFDINGHKHSSESYEIHFCLGGKGSVVLEERKYDLYKNMIYVTGPDVWNRQIIDKEDPLDEICIYIQKVSTGKDRLSRTFNSTHFWVGPANETIKNLFFSLLSLKEQRTYYANEKKNHFTGLIIAELSYLYTPDFLMEVDDTLDDTKFMIIEMAFIYDYHFITLEELSERLGLSPRQTQRILQEYYGTSFREKLIKSRLEAGILKMYTGKSVGQSALEVGYADAQSFIRAFKKYYGKTPAQYIKEDM